MLVAWLTKQFLTLNVEDRRLAQESTEDSMWRLDEFLGPLIRASQSTSPQDEVKNPSKFFPTYESFAQLRNVISEVGAPISRLGYCRILLWLVRGINFAHGGLLILWLVLSLSVEAPSDSNAGVNEPFLFTLMYGAPLALMFLAGSVQLGIRLFFIPR